MGYQQQDLYQLRYRLSVASTHSATLRSVLSTPIRHPLSDGFSIWLLITGALKIERRILILIL